MKMNLCGTCRFWERPSNDGTGEIPGSGRCKAVVLYWEATKWETMDDGGYYRILKPRYADAKAFVKDGSDYWAALYTLSTFGCVQHQPQEHLCTSSLQ